MAPSNSELLEKLYMKVTEQVLSPDGLSIDEKVLNDVKNTWPRKLAAHRALQPPPGITHSAPALDVFRMVPIQIAKTPRSDGKAVTALIPVSYINVRENAERLTGVIQSPSGDVALRTMPVEMASSILQKNIDKEFDLGISDIEQVDGANDSSDDDDVKEVEKREEMKVEEQQPMEEAISDESLNSDDDWLRDDETSSSKTETANLLVCQWKEMTKKGNSLKLKLRNGLMTLNGRDYIFHKANGSIKW